MLMTYCEARVKELEDTITHLAQTAQVMTNATHIPPKIDGPDWNAWLSQRAALRHVITAWDATKRYLEYSRGTCSAAAPCQHCAAEEGWRDDE